jgi:predicted AAA+ superfamily ATPase
MIERPFWINQIEQAWREVPIVWLAGVRRVGKTVLAESLGSERMVFVNCDLPIVADMVSHPELFFRNCEKPLVVFDEVHQLKDPSLVLKIGADLFPEVRILATGSSTLAASSRFRDTLTGRKRQVHLTPVLWSELPAFEKTSLLKRLYHGGLPQALLSDSKSPYFYREWMDSFFARDIHKLYGFREPNKFNALFEFVLKQSGGLLETAKTASSLGISRPTVESHLRALAETHAITLLRPFHGGGQKELVKTPKVYAFDTGFVSFCRGWDPLRPDDYGQLWEHLVLEFLQAHSGGFRLHYWRDSLGREIDFVIPRNRDEIDLIECKWDPSHFDSSAAKLFRSYYPAGNNYLINPQSHQPFYREYSGMKMLVCNPDGWLLNSVSTRPKPD